MRFDEYYFTEGGKTVEGVVSNLKIEYGIVDVINTGKTRLLRFEPAIKEIVKHFNLTDNAQHTGKMQGKIKQEYIDIVKKLNPKVVKSINKTSKTDFITGNNKISLKLNKGWLFSHQLEGTEACLVSVLNKFKNIQSELIDEIKNILQELRSIPKEKQEKSFVLKDKLTNRFIEIFKSFEERIKIEFLKAALSGNFKFEENDIALPNKLMVVRYKNKKMSTTKAFLDLNNIDLDNSGIYDILKDDDYIRKLVESCRLSFRMQKTGTLRLDINSCNFTNDLLNEYNEFLSEDFFGNLQNLMKKGYEFAKDKIQKFFNFLIQLIGKGVSYFLDFFGIKIEPEFENEIIFS